MFILAHPPPREAAEELRGCYAHIAALADGLGLVLDAIREAGIEQDQAEFSGTK